MEWTNAIGKMVPMDLLDAGLPQTNLWKNTSVPCILPLRLAHWLPAPPGPFPAPSGSSSGAVPAAEIKSWAFEVGTLTPKILGYQRTNPGEYHKGKHLNTRPSITQPPVAPVQDASSKQQTKWEYKPNHQQTRLPPHSVLPTRGKTNAQKLSTNLTL